MEAPWSDQLKLLEIQRCDSQISKLQHGLKKLPEKTQQKTLEAQIAQLEQKSVQAKTLLGDLERKGKKLAAELSTIRDRQVTQRTRLDSGAGSPKELLALQSELDQIRGRIEKLEDRQLQIMTEAERIEVISTKIADRQAGLKEQIADLEKIITKENQEVTQKLETLTKERNELAGQIKKELLEVYAEVKEKTGGVGAVKLIGLRAQDLDLHFSAAESSRILQARAEEIIFSEDYDYILVRTPE